MIVFYYFLLFFFKCKFFFFFKYLACCTYVSHCIKLKPNLKKKEKDLNSSVMETEAGQDIKYKV